MELIDTSFCHPNLLLDDGREISLPHGSGIDCRYSLEETADGCILRNEYHCMDQNGMYAGYVPIEFHVNKEGKLIDVFVDMETAHSIVEEYDILETEDGDTECNAPYLDDLEDYLWQTWDCYAETVN